MRRFFGLLLIGGFVWGALFLLPGVVLAAPACPAPSTPIVITEVRHLYFGLCDAVGGQPYVVDPADAPGTSACFAAHSARFEVTGEPGCKVNLNFTMTIPLGTLTVTQKISPTGGNVSFDGSGNLTVFMGGRVSIPAGFTTTPLTTTSQLEVVYP